VVPILHSKGQHSTVKGSTSHATQMMLERNNAACPRTLRLKMYPLCYLMPAP
jgi:hypothetical protein